MNADEKSDDIDKTIKYETLPSENMQGFPINKVIAKGRIKLAKTG